MGLATLPADESKPFLLRMIFNSRLPFNTRGAGVEDRALFAL